MVNKTAYGYIQYIVVNSTSCVYSSHELYSSEQKVIFVKQDKAMGEPPAYTPANPLSKIPLYEYFTNRRLVLASASPQRLNILVNNLNLPNVEVHPSGFPENLEHLKDSPLDYCVETATQKALAAYKELAALEDESGALPNTADDKRPKELGAVISADTIIVSRHKVVEKPRSAREHVEMLKRLRDAETHTVITAVCVIVPLEVPIQPGYVFNSHAEETAVSFDQDVSDEFIMAYVRAGEGRDKAGGYAIQGMGSIFVDGITGDFWNVVGLPVNKTFSLIEKAISLAKGEIDEDCVQCCG